MELADTENAYKFAESALRIKGIIDLLLVIGLLILDYLILKKVYEKCKKDSDSDVGMAMIAFGMILVLANLVLGTIIEEALVNVFVPQISILNIR